MSKNESKDSDTFEYDPIGLKIIDEISKTIFWKLIILASFLFFLEFSQSQIFADDNSSAICCFKN